MKRRLYAAGKSNRLLRWFRTGIRRAKAVSQPARGRQRGLVPRTDLWQLGSPDRVCHRCNLGAGHRRAISEDSVLNGMLLESFCQRAIPVITTTPAAAAAAAA